MLGVEFLFFTKVFLPPLPLLLAAVRKLKCEAEERATAGRKGVFESILTYDWCLYQHRL